jgi:hypothetical protein
MSTPSLLSRLAHLPWIGAGIVLVFGLAFWGLSPASSDAKPEPSQTPAFQLDEAGFRKLIEAEAQELNEPVEKR